jgi:hypothetical protein
MQMNHCEALSELDLEQAAGGGALTAAIKLAKKHVPEIIGTVTGTIAGWLSE